MQNLQYTQRYPSDYKVKTDTPLNTLVTSNHNWYLTSSKYSGNSPATIKMNTLVAQEQPLEYHHEYTM